MAPTKRQLMKNDRLNNLKPTNTQTINFNHSSEGNLFIPDISGFTKFVQETDINIGKHIISRLLTVLLKSNILHLKVSEIEGDAILFYKMGKRLSGKEILSQFRLMYNNFLAELYRLSEETGIQINLGLKLIAHYGLLSQYRVGNFTNLYGASVIEAHRLLKNSINRRDYIIITDNLLNGKSLPNNLNFGNKICETYSQLESICFTWLDLKSEFAIDLN